MHHTRAVLGAQNFLLHGRTGAERNYDWLEYFDVVITGALAQHHPAAPCLEARPGGYASFTRLLMHGLNGAENYPCSVQHLELDRCKIRL